MLKMHNLNPDGSLDESATKRVLLRDEHGVPTGDFAVVEMRTLEYYNRLARKFRRFERDPKGSGGSWTVDSLAVNEALLLECVKSWSAQAKDGSIAPITADAIKCLDPRAKAQLVAEILGNELSVEEGPTEAESFREPADVR